MTYRRTIEVEKSHDDIIGGCVARYWRTLQPVNKDGRDSKRTARRTGACLIVYPDGGYRYYGPVKVTIPGLCGTMTSISLRRERITKTYREAEMSTPTWEEEYHSIVDELEGKD